MRYELVTGDARELHRFIELINELIEEGWEPLGGATVNGSQIIQTITNTTQPNNK